MGYTDYDFYTNTYYGVPIEESSFDKWNAKATDKLNSFIKPNLTDDALTEYSEEIQKATCCLIEIMYKLDYAETNATNAKNGNVKSMSSGGQSVTFGNNDTLITSVLADRRMQNRLMLDLLADYLGDTGLLAMDMED